MSKNFIELLGPGYWLLIVLTRIPHTRYRMPLNLWRIRESNP